MSAPMLYLISASWPGVLTAPTPPPCPNPVCRGGGVSYPEWEGRVEDCEDCRGSGVAPSGTPIAVIRAAFWTEPDEAHFWPAAVVAVGVSNAKIPVGTDHPALLAEGATNIADGKVIVVLRDVVDIDPPITEWYVGAEEFGQHACLVGSLSGPWGVVPDALAAATKEHR